MVKEKGALGGLDVSKLQDLLKEEKARQKQSIEAGVTVDTGVRLAIIAAALVLPKSQADAYMNSFKERLLRQYSDEDRVVAEKTFEDIRKAVHFFSDSKL